MTNIFRNIPESTEQRYKKPSAAELFCFVFLFAGLTILMVPSAQRRSTLLPRVAIAAPVATKNKVVAAKKIAWHFGWSRTGSVVR